MCILRVASRARQGFSLVEALVALVLVTVGLLGIVGSSALALRVANDAARERAAARRVTDRIARIAAAGCDAAAGGQLSNGDGSTERWSVRRQSDHIELTDSLAWSSATARRSFVVTSALQC